MPYRFCPECHTRVPANHKFCHECGLKLETHELTPLETLLERWDQMSPLLPGGEDRTISPEIKQRLTKHREKMQDGAGIFPFHP